MMQYVSGLNSIGPERYSLHPCFRLSPRWNCPGPLCVFPSAASSRHLFYFASHDLARASPSSSSPPFPQSIAPPNCGCFLLRAEDLGAYTTTMDMSLSLLFLSLFVLLIFNKNPTKVTSVSLATREASYAATPRTHVACLTFHPPNKRTAHPCVFFPPIVVNSEQDDCVHG